MSKKIDIIFIKEFLNNMGYELKKKKKKNAKTKLDIKCNNKHVYKMTWSALKAGKKCAICSKNAKFDIDKVRKLFEKENYVLLSNTYVNNSTKLDYVCDKGHKHSICLRDWNRGSRCPYCNGRTIYTINYIKDVFFKEGYILLSKEYKNLSQKLDFICPNGHRHNISFRSWLAGRRCYMCYGNVKKHIDFLKNSFEKEGYVLLSDTYDGCQKHMEVVCPKGHKYKVTWDNWNSKSSRCPVCNNNGTSRSENILVDIIKNNIDCSVLIKDRSVCKPKELDIIIPDKKIAIEYCGLYWHSELAGKNKNYHLDKLTCCLSKDYKLITIFEDEFINKHDILLSRLGSILGFKNYETIYARNCEIKEISSKLAKKFCEENHLQGYGSGASIKLGAFCNNELVSIMTFSKPSLSKGNRVYKEAVWELHRFCSKINTRVVGIASKLLKYFEKNYKWKEIFSYADRRWSDGNLYEKLRFDFDSYTKPNYWYLPYGCSDRIHRFYLRKNKQDDSNLTEWENRVKQGYNRVWDCGNLKYVKHNKYY